MKITHPHIGVTKFDSVAPSHEAAQAIAARYYEQPEIKRCHDQSGAYWSVESNGSFQALIGYIGGDFALLMKDGGETRRTLFVGIQLNPEVTQ